MNKSDRGNSGLWMEERHGVLAGGVGFRILLACLPLSRRDSILANKMMAMKVREVKKVEELDGNRRDV